MAGYYYPAQADQLAQAIRRLTKGDPSPMAAQAVVVPHGSLDRCGAVTGSTLSRVRLPRRCILLGPSHTGTWLPWAVMGAGAYRTPLGEVPIDERCVEALLKRCPFLTVDPSAHRGEHALEVILPFLQALGPSDLQIVPVVMGIDDVEECHMMAQALAQVVRLQEEPVLLVASSDLSQYQPVDRVRANDRHVVDALVTLDSAALRHQMAQERGAFCGFGALLCVMEAARRLGATHGTLHAYATSADAGGDPYAAVGYAGVMLHD